MSEDKPAAEADDDIVMIEARVRVDADGYYMIRDTAECESRSDFDDAWKDMVGGDEAEYRDAIVEIRIRKPSHSLPTAEVTVPDAPAEPVAASVA